MSKWVTVVLVLTFLTFSFIISSQVNSALAGQIIGASTSISVAVLGFWVFFKKSKSLKD